MRRYTPYFILAIALILLMPGKLHAQTTNEYNIPDVLFDFFKRARVDFQSDRCQALSDSMYNMASAMGEKKAMIMAKTILVHRSVREMDVARTASIVSDICRMSREYGYMQYYYFAKNQMVTLQINMRHFDDALILSHEIMEEALRNDYSPGKYYAYTSLGNIYYICGCYNLAIRYHEMAIREYETNRITLPAQSYRVISDCYFFKEDFKASYDIACQEIRLRRSGSANSVGKLGLLMAMLDKKDELKALRDSFISGSMSRQMRSALKVPRLYMENKEDSIKLILKKNSLYELIILKHLAIKNGDMRKALLYEKEISEVSDKMRGNDLGQVFSMDSKFRLEQEKSRNLKLSLRKADLELGNMKSRTGINLAQSRQSYLEIMKIRDSLYLEELEMKNSKERYDDSKKAAALEASLIEKSMMDKESKRKMMLLLVTSSLLLLLAIAMASIRSLHNKRIHILDAMQRTSEAKRQKDIFLQNMSHEIRTPLSAIIGFSSIITEMGNEISFKEKQEYKDLIVSNTDLLTMLIDDLLAISAMHGHTISVSYSLVSPRDICQVAEGAVMARCPSLVRMFTTCSTPDGFTFESDGKRITQVLVNFLTNACKHTAEGEIETEVHTEGDRIIFSVRDTGEGIQKDKQDLLFCRFEMLGTTAEGTGIGLNICKMIASALEGDIYLDKNYTNGARFCLELPLKRH